MKCINPNCQKEISNDGKFCNYCGTKQPERIKCSKCKCVNIPKNAIFCPNCGERLDTSPGGAEMLRLALDLTESKRRENELRLEEERKKREVEDKRLAEIKAKEENLRKQEEERKKREAEEKRLAEIKVKQEECRKQEEIRQHKLTEFNKKKKPIEKGITDLKLSLEKLNHKEKLYMNNRFLFEKENAILSRWKSSGLGDKIDILKNDYSNEYQWWPRMLIYWKKYTLSGWDSYPICFKEYFMNFLFIITYPFRLIVLIPWLWIIIYLLPIYIVGYPFYKIGCWFDLLKLGWNYKKKHKEQQYIYCKEMDRVDIDKCKIEISDISDQISSLQDKLSSIEKEYQTVIRIW